MGGCMSTKVSFVALVGARDSRNVWYFLRADHEKIGVEIIPVQSDKNLKHQLQLGVASFLHGDDWAQYIDQVVVRCHLTPDLIWSQSERSLLFLVEVPSQMRDSRLPWITLPELLRSLPKTKNRITFMKAFQALGDPDDSEITAVEFDEKFARELGMLF